MTKTMTSILEDNRFYKLADRYLPLVAEDGTPQDYRGILFHKYEKVNQNEFLIPVLGVQGAGKSSLLNALLMDDLILPVDADETTCIPVEIRYSEEKNGQMEVYFQGKQAPIPLTNPKEIEQYVHNTYNPGNEKDVSHIVVYKVSDILKNGVVFVDLPGVSSLTQQNMKTTMSYIEKLSAAIFLLRTVPPITRSERVFLSTAWPKLTKAWFIQNQWNDESKKEVQDGMEHNKRVLNEIAAIHKTNEETDIRIVNVYKALNGRLQDDEKALADSGLVDFTNFLSNITNKWHHTISEKFADDLVVLVKRLRGKLEELQADTQLDRKTLRKKYREQERKFDEIIQENQSKISRIQLMMSNYETELRNYAQTQSKVQAENLRNEMRRVTGNKVVDGDLLTTAFQENQQMFALDTIEGLNDKLFEVKKRLEDELGELQVKNMDNQFENIESFYKESSFKFEKGLAPAISVGGSLGGLYAGAAIGTAIGGPIGTVIGGVVGIGIGLFSLFVGKKSKEFIESQRRSATMADLEKPIQSFQAILQNAITEHVSAYFTSIRQTLKHFIASQERQLEAEREENRQQLNLSEEDVAERRQQIEEDLAYLEKIEVSL
jgi:mitofusin 1